MTARPRRLAGHPVAGALGRSYESAVLGTDGKFHRLQPDALLGTLRCGTGRVAGGRTEWQHAERVKADARCPGCYA